MRNISLGVINYSSHKKHTIPAYTVDANGHRLHSWRTLILPYIEEASLYQKIRLDEPWDSEYNQQFHDVKLSVYCCPSDSNRDKPITNYFLVTGPGTLFNGSETVSDEEFFTQKKQILLIESSKSVHWMCPEDISLADYEAGSVPPVTSSHRNIIFTNGEAVENGIIERPSWLSHFSTWEVFYGHVLPILLAITILVVTIIQLARFLWEYFHYNIDAIPQDNNCEHR